MLDVTGCLYFELNLVKHAVTQQNKVEKLKEAQRYANLLRQAKATVTKQLNFIPE